MALADLVRQLNLGSVIRGLLVWILNWPKKTKDISLAGTLEAQKDFHERVLVGSVLYKPDIQVPRERREAGAIKVIPEPYKSGMCPFSAIFARKQSKKQKINLHEIT